MRATILVLCVLILFMNRTNAQSGTDGTLTLKQSIETGIANNLQVQQRAISMERAGVQRAQAKGNIVPRLNANILHGTSQGRNIDRSSNTYINQTQSLADFNLNSDVSIFRGFSLMNRLRGASLAYDAAKLELEQEKYDLTLRIILAYLTILNNEDQLTQSRNQLELSHKQVERLELLNQQGAIPPSQLYDLKGQFANDELAILNNQNAVENAKLDLAELMGVPYDKNMKLERLTADQFTLLYEATPESIYQVAMQELAMIKAANLRRESALKVLKSARGALAPDFYLTGNLSTNYFKTKGQTSVKYIDQLKNNYGTFIGIGISIPIIDNFNRRNTVKLEKLNVKSSEVNEQNLHVQLQQLISQSYINMKNAQDRYKVLLQQVEAFGLSFRAAEVRFNAGLGTSVDYLTAKNNYDRANINLVNARYDYVLRTKILDYYQNKPLW